MSIPERIFYKYSNTKDYSIDSLKNKYMYFSRPSELNDPEDCRIPIELKSDDEHYLQWILHAKKLHEVITKNKAGKYPIATVDELKEQLETNDTFCKRLKEIGKEAIEFFHIYSMSETNKNKQLWSSKDYNTDFSGFCLGFKTYQLRFTQGDKTIFVPTKIENANNKIPYFFINKTYSYFILKKVEYDNDKRHFYNIFENTYDQNHMLENAVNDKNKENIEYNFFHKTQRWKKEKEWRGFYVTNDKKDSKIYFPDCILDSVTFGYKIEKTKREEIFKILKNNFSNFKEIKLLTANPKGSDGVEIKSVI